MPELKVLYPTLGAAGASGGGSSGDISGGLGGGVLYQAGLAFKFGGGRQPRMPSEQ